MLSILLILMMLGIPPLTVLIGIALVATSLALSITLFVFSRTRRPRICTTIIDEHGLRDVRPETTESLSWEQISKIEIFRGDIYFFTNSGNLVYIPFSAFPSFESATEIFKQARGLKNRADDQNSLLDVHGTQPSMPKIEDEESVWKALEDRHEKTKAAETQPK
jgi:hypothetical protein